MVNVIALDRNLPLAMSFSLRIGVYWFKVRSDISDVECLDLYSKIKVLADMPVQIQDEDEDGNSSQGESPGASKSNPSTVSLNASFLE